MDRTCQLISEDRCYNVKTKLRPDKTNCHSTYHIKNVNNFLSNVGPKLIWRQF